MESRKLQLSILLKGSKSRPQQLCLIASNAPKTMDGICWDYKKKAEMASETHEPENLFGFVAECDPEDFPSKDSTRIFPARKNWDKANPGLRYNLPTEYYIKNEIRTAHTPKEKLEVSRLQFGLVPGDAGGLFERKDWDSVQIDKLDDNVFKVLYNPSTTTLYGALDLSIRQNLCAFGELYVPHDRSIKPLLKVKYWTPDIGLEDRDKQAVGGHLISWVKRDYIEKTEGSVVDYLIIGEHLARLSELYKDYHFCSDQAHSIHLTNACSKNGIPMEILVTKQDFDKFEDVGQIKIITHSQGAYPNRQTKLGMNQSIDDLRTSVCEERIYVEHNPVTDWCLECCQVKADEHRMEKLDKKTATKHNKGTDDGAVAITMVCGLWQLNERNEGPKDSNWLEKEYEKDSEFNPFLY